MNTGHHRAAWVDDDGQLAATIPAAAGGHYVIRMPKAEAEQLSAELFQALVEDRQHDADADR